MSSCSHKNYHTRILLAGAILITVISALPYAGGWNDGSRLASVESLADYHTLIIDESVFVKTPGIVTKNAALAWPPNNHALIDNGTLDKLFIKDHYYSELSPLPSVIMAGVYKAVQTATGLTASENPPLFCYVMTVIFSGMAYVIAVCCMDAMLALMGLSCAPRLLLAWSFALATVALPYVRNVNNHIMLLGLFSAIMFLAVGYTLPGENKQWRLMMIGSLAGIGYTIDLGTGPVLVLAVTGFIILQTRSWQSVALALMMALPWFLMHHLLNYRIGGTFGPVNSVPEYFEWPGCPFKPEILTGHWLHPNLWHFFVYAIDLLFGKRGFFGHNIALYLSIPAIVFLLRNKSGRTPLVYFSLSLILGTWLLYSVASNNHSGVCCSIRWFVPLLVPFYYLLAAFLKERPDYTTDLLILSAWGLVMGALMWIGGPWKEIKLLVFILLQAVALISWLGWRWKVTGAGGNHI